MSDIKSYQRLLAVQAIYESSINNKEIDTSFDEFVSHIVDNTSFKNKIKGKIGTFSFKDRKVIQDLDIYKVENKKFIKF